MTNAIASLNGECLREKYTKQGVSPPMICSFNLIKGKKGNTLQGREGEESASLSLIP